MNLEQAGLESVGTFKALASGTRVRILLLLADGDMNINEIGHALGMAQPTVTKHVNVLEEAGLVTSDYTAGAQGMQKRCHLRYERVTATFEGAQPPGLRVEEVSMPLGMYTAAEPHPTCGLASAERPIGLTDDPLSFFFPDRAAAQLLWMGSGFVEYVFPNVLPSSFEVSRLELSMEVCSEAPGYNLQYPSDITVWINGLEIGTWTSPGDMGGRRGRLNPMWWNDHGTQFGLLKIWSVDSSGSYIDGVRISSCTASHLRLVPHHPVAVRIGIKPDAEHLGGFNLFGRGFGNYEQDLLLRLHYRPLPLRKALPGTTTASLTTAEAVPVGTGTA